MRQVGSHGVPNDRGLGFQPTDALSKAMDLQTQKRSYRQPNVVALRPRRTCLATLDFGTLLDATMVVLDGPTVLRVLLSRQVRHRQVAGRPVSNVAVWGDDLEYLDQPVTGQPDFGSRGGNLGSVQRPRPLTVAVDQPIALQACQPLPAQGAQALEVFQAAVPAIEDHATRLETPPVGVLQHKAEVVILGDLGVMVDAVVAGDMAVAVGPQQRHEVDALNNGMVLARPVASDEFDGLGEDGAGDRILARITRRSQERLGLAEGASVHAQIKSVALSREGGA